MMSWPCRLSSAASALSRRQLPQYILAAPAVNASIFIRSFGDRTNCSKTRHVGLNVFILERMAGNAFGIAVLTDESVCPTCQPIWALLICLLLPLAASGQFTISNLAPAEYRI